MSDIKIRKYKGLYLGKYATHEQAVQFAVELCRRYDELQKIGKPLTVKKMIEIVYEEQKVVISDGYFRDWLKKLGYSTVRVSHYGRNEKPTYRKVMLLLTEDDYRPLERFSNKNAIIRIAIRLLTGAAQPDVLLVYFDTNKPVLFTQKKGAISAHLLKTLKKETMELVKAVTRNAHKEGGIQYIQQFASDAKLKYMGGA